MSPKPRSVNLTIGKTVKKVTYNDVDGKEFQHKSHLAFVKNLRLAQKTSKKKNKTVEILWRGYRTFVEPTSPDFSTEVLRQRLLIALREIKKIHKLKDLPKEEEKVSLIF